MKNLSDSGWLALIVIVSSILFQISIPHMALSQDSGEAPAPEVVESPPNFPDYIVRPREETNPYDLSTITPDNNIEYREGAGTLGTTTESKSNLEVNEMLRKNKEERDRARTDAQKKSSEEQSAAQEAAASVQEQAPATQSSKSGSITPGVKGGLFRWIDKDGVLHATNDLGQVPIEYQLEALENSNNLDVNKSQGKNR